MYTVMSAYTMEGVCVRRCDSLRMNSFTTYSFHYPFME